MYRVYTVNTTKGKQMENYTITELEELLANAYTQRKQAYAMRAPKFVTSAINNQITSLRLAIVAKGN
jgi:hypothetical protein